MGFGAQRLRAVFEFGVSGFRPIDPEARLELFDLERFDPERF